MKKRIFTIILSALITLIAVGQETDKKTKEKVADTKKEMKDVDKSIDQGQKNVNKNYQQFKRETEKKLDKLDKSIADLDTRVQNMNEKDRSKYEIRLKNLKEKNKALRVKLNDYKDDDDTSEKFEDFQEELQKDFTTLENALDDFFEDNKK